MTKGGDLMLMLFAGCSFYAKGGFNDFQGCFPDIYSATQHVVDNEAGQYGWDWYQIIDQKTLKVLVQSACQAYGSSSKSYCPDED